MGGIYTLSHTGSRGITGFTGSQPPGQGHKPAGRPISKRGAGNTRGEHKRPDRKSTKPDTLTRTTAQGLPASRLLRGVDGKNKNRRRQARDKISNYEMSP